MQEINLLQNKVKDRTLAFERNNKLLMGICLVILTLELIGAGLLWLSTSSENNKIRSLQSSNATIQSQITQTEKQAPAAKSAQAQLKNVQTLLNNHIYWTGVFGLLASKDPQKVRYTNVDGSVADGKISIQGVAASYTEVGNLILSLSTANDQFKDVKLISVNPSQGANAGYSFSLSFKATNTAFSKK